MGCILGIKQNGLSLQIDTLSIESDQKDYHYICNVNLLRSDNGNGSYEVSIVDKNMIQGFPVGTWMLTKANIWYNWGESTAEFTISDSNGHETNTIIASKQRGSKGGFDIETLARSIFYKAQKIVSEYPSAAICDAILALEEKESVYTWTYVNESIEKASSCEDYLDTVKYGITKLLDYLEEYTKTRKMLGECKDPRAKDLSARISNSCQNLICKLNFSNTKVLPHRNYKPHFSPEERQRLLEIENRKDK